MATNSNLERLPRLLALVPYLQARPGIPAAEAAADFGVTEKQLRADLQLLWMCGLPGHGPGDLIDLSFEGETISVVFDAGMSRPLRLTAEEALALVVGLRTLSEMPGIADSEAVQRALAKVEQVAGSIEETVAVSLDDAERLVPVLRRAVEERRALRLRYFSASHDEVSDRVIDPLQVFESDGRTYVEAWCRQAEGMRIFRADRIEDVELLDEPAVVPDDVQPRDLTAGVFQPAAEHLLVDLRLQPSYAWVADYYPAEEVVAEQADVLRLSLRVSDPAWVRSLVLGSAGQVEVISPEWLAAGLRDIATRALARYASK